jgi:hypothetical protein
MVTNEQQTDMQVHHGVLLPAALQPHKADEWLNLPDRDRALVTTETVYKWTEGLHEDDWTVADIVRLERKRQTSLQTLRSGAELGDLEWRMLRYLQRNEGRTCTYLQLARHLWGTARQPVTAYSLRRSGMGYDSPMVRHIWVIISVIRKRLEIDPLRPQHLATVRGVGYRWYSQPPSLHDGEDYAKRALETERQRDQMRAVFGLTEGGPIDPLDDVDGLPSRFSLGPEHPDYALQEGDTPA